MTEADDLLRFTSFQHVQRIKSIRPVSIFRFIRSCQYRYNALDPIFPTHQMRIIFRPSCGAKADIGSIYHLPDACYIRQAKSFAYNRRIQQLQYGLCFEILFIQ